VDVLLQLLLPELKPVVGLEFQQEVFSWGGVEYPQEPVKYLWGSHVELIPRDLQTHIPWFLPEGFLDDGWVFLDVEGDGLDLLEGEVNGMEMDWGGKRLDDLLALLLKQSDQWAVLFELHSDQIDSVYKLTVDECMRKLKANLKRDIKREGFIAYK
jgi:hypothetical protein